jgi:hypothetical protein
MQLDIIGIDTKRLSHFTTVGNYPGEEKKVSICYIILAVCNTRVYWNVIVVLVEAMDFFIGGNNVVL